MKKALRFLAAVALLAPAAFAQTNGPVVTPGDNLVVEGVPAIPASVADEVRRYTEYRTAGLASWHPVRREMLIGTRFGDTPQVHIVRTPLGARTQLTFFPERVGGAKFRPKTGDYFVFSKDIGGNEFFQFYRYDVASGEVTLLTDGKSRNVGSVWSHGGEWLAYGSTRRNGKDVDVYLVNPADPKTTRMLLQVEGGGWGVEDFSPDDKKLLVGEGVSANESYLWLVDAQTGEKTLITPKGGAEKIHYGGGQFSKDGRGLYTTTDKDSEFHRLAYIDLATKEHTYLTDHIKWDVDDFALSPDGKTIAFITNEDGADHLHLLDTKSRKEKKVTVNLPTGLMGGLQWHENGRDLGFTYTSARSAADVYSLDVQTGKVERWTESETGGLNVSNLPDPQLVRWQSFDGKQISGFLYMPPAGKFNGARPVIINIHGGPEGQSLPGFQGRNNYFLNEMGVAIIYPNVRGSSGYGKTFLALDNGFKREDSYKDIGALLDWIKTRPELDASRVMVTGGSYGGHMAFAIATLYSDRIRASLPVVGISNLVSFLERTEAYRRDLRRVEYGDERDPKMREFMLRTAPMTNAKNITKPLFVVAGGNDPRVPVNEAEQMVKTVRSNNTPVWYLMAKDEGHGFAKKKNQDFQFYATIMFVRETLLK
ncbi:MAG TPA: prolyl oligopeptidase family serine peptidase [Pyrinomonadaceae bacterium]|jgi:dipeptidyl aminopeptidase/acylaminoacyl peptidase|nr:prolyl oligopeptidase family serine peptidase [Pyrinomonadaceae bacterium]